MTNCKNPVGTIYNFEWLACWDSLTEKERIELISATAELKRGSRPNDGTGMFYKGIKTQLERNVNELRKRAESSVTEQDLEKLINMEVHNLSPINIHSGQRKRELEQKKHSEALSASLPKLEPLENLCYDVAISQLALINREPIKMNDFIINHPEATEEHIKISNDLYEAWIKNIKESEPTWKFLIKEACDKDPSLNLKVYSPEELKLFMDKISDQIDSRSAIDIVNKFIVLSESIPMSESERVEAGKDVDELFDKAGIPLNTAERAEAEEYVANMPTGHDIYGEGISINKKQRTKKKKQQHTKKKKHTKKKQHTKKKKKQHIKKKKKQHTKKKKHKE